MVTLQVPFLLVSLCFAGCYKLKRVTPYIIYRVCASRRMLVATCMSFLACMSACLAALLLKPIDTNIAMEDSGGSGIGICPTEG